MPSEGLVYAIDHEIVLKVPFQQLVRDADTSSLDQSLKSFVCQERELAVYQSLERNPHANLVRRLKTSQVDCLFLERLTPLENAWQLSSQQDQRRWALELLDAVSWLERNGWVHGDLAIRNLGVDGTNRLKLFDFGSAIPRSHSDYSNEMARDHFGLATCLHFILSGDDPFSRAQSYSEVREIQRILATGHGLIKPGAKILTDMIQDGWTGHASSLTFGQALQRAISKIKVLDQSIPLEQSDSHYRQLEARCRDWLDQAVRNPDWKNIKDYSLACEAAGHEVDLDVWR